MAPKTKEQIVAEKRQAILQAFDKLGNLSAVARQLGIPRRTVQHHLRASGRRNKPIAAGRIKPTRVEVRTPPVKGVRRYIATCAQNNTNVNMRALENMRAIGAHYKVQPEDWLCSSFSYNQNAFGELATKRGKAHRDERLWYDPEILPLLDRSDQNIELAPKLMWCGRMNTLPTAVHPLRGFEQYTGRNSGIFPHATVAMESISSGKFEATKFNYTTGCITQRNYIQKREGLRAEEAHSYGGLLIEVSSKGWWVRQLIADSKNRIQDLTILAQDGRVTTGHRVQSINWGDIHVPEMMAWVRKLGWGKGGMLDELRPFEQFINDVTSFRGRNAYDIRNPHRMFERWVDGGDDVEVEMREVAQFFVEAVREWCKTIVVKSNHDDMLERWLREADYRNDPQNALFFLRMQLAKYRAMAKPDPEFLLIEHCLRSLGCPEPVRFLREDESYITCKDSRGGIENGMHGHLGPRGARGSLAAFARMGRRTNTGHDHGAAIRGPSWQAGACSHPADTTYASGPNNWSPSHIVTYPIGTRSMVTMWEDDYRAR